MKKIIIKNKYLKLVVLIFAIAIPLVVWGVNFDPVSFKYSSGLNSYSYVINANGQNTIIYNHSSINYFIPNKTAVEWDSFLAHKPANVDVAVCGDSYCDAGVGETCSDCVADCGACAAPGKCVLAPGPYNDCWKVPHNSQTCYSINNQSGTTNVCNLDGYGNCTNKPPFTGEACWALTETNCYGAGGEACIWTTDSSKWLHCGDGVCAPSIGETLYNCSADCSGLYCGDGSCNNNETCSTCPYDCGTCGYCGDGVCANGETCSSCSGDCGTCSASCCLGSGTCSTWANPMDCSNHGCNWSTVQSCRVID